MCPFNFLQNHPTQPMDLNSVLMEYNIAAAIGHIFSINIRVKSIFSLI